MCTGMKAKKINGLLIFLSVSLLKVRISSENDNVQLNLKVQKVERRFSVELNCTVKEEPFPVVGVFYFNNVSLANISPSNGLCYLGPGRCRTLQCECGLKYFIYRHTFSFDVTESIFTCEIRFNKSKGGHKKNVAVRASVFYNNSGKLLSYLPKRNQFKYNIMR